MASLLTPLVVALCLAGCADTEPEEAPEPGIDEAVPPPLVRQATEARVAVDVLDVSERAEPLSEPPPAVPMTPERRAEYEAVRAKELEELQPWRRTVRLDDRVVLTDLHPRHHRWLILRVAGATYHLENPDPDELLVDLERSDATGLALVHPPDGRVNRCAPWAGDPPELARVQVDTRLYAPICEHLLVRHPGVGHRTPMEWSADFLRDQLKGGEHLSEMVKRGTVGRHRQKAKLREGEALGEVEEGPRPVDLVAGQGQATVARGSMGLPVDGPERLPAGRFAPVRGHPGLSVALLTPGLAAEPADPEDRALVAGLDPKEAGALVALVAIDLDAYEIGFEIGSDHPRVDWSARAPASQVDPSMPGPDGIGSVQPLVRTGQVTALEAEGLVATFTGGFKRDHGAFKSGPMATSHYASHYGLIQDGVVLSKLQPGLSTLVVWDAATVELLTWSEELEGELDRIRHARQNGVPLVETRGGTPRAGALVDDWRAGNWSGSVTGELRSLRAGACLKAGPGGRYLVYGYFTGATPRAMARVFLAAGCEHAMHLDMNALEHTYMAVYERSAEGAWTVHHLDTGMSVLDKARKGIVLPRFVAFPDNRDFFTVQPREGP